VNSQTGKHNQENSHRGEEEREEIVCGRRDLNPGYHLIFTNVEPDNYRLALFGWLFSVDIFRELLRRITAIRDAICKDHREKMC
jgi:hypothetical protein